MTTSPAPGLLVEGRVVHKTSNALKITFNDGPGDPIAVGVQGAGDGRGAKAAILFGFKNGGTGRHVLTYADGTALEVQSRSAQPTLLTRGGTEFVSVERGDTAVARDTAGRTVATFTADPDEAKTPDIFRVQISDGRGDALAELTVIRRVAGWSLWRTANAINDMTIWWDRAGEPLKTPLLGTRLALTRPATAAERDVLLGACVDITLGLRPYTAAMN